MKTGKTAVEGLRVRGELRGFSHMPIFLVCVHVHMHTCVYACSVGQRTTLDVMHLFRRQGLSPAWNLSSRLG